MKLTLQLESAKHDGSSSLPVDATWQMIVDRWRRATSKNDEHALWVRGAISVFARFTSESETVLFERLGPVVSVSQTSMEQPGHVGLPVFKEGRSTPAPARHPGAQRPVV